MAEMQRCQVCGSDVYASLSAEGLCPACLLWLGLGRDQVPGDKESTMPRSDAPRGGRGEVRSRLDPGQRFGPYHIERLLGKGGMGEVYEAEDLESGRRVALKVLTHGLGDQGDRARFLREGRLAAAISHPHTVYVYGTDEIDGLPVIAMELASGGTLKDRVKEKGPLPSKEAVDAILQVISGLGAATAAGVLHRDVKPSNCFVDGEGGVKVGDFGLSISTLARAERDVTASGTFLGTPAFASPEQLRGEELDHRSDIYAVGATLYYLLTGHAPFEDTNILKLATMIAQETPPPLSKLRRGIPQGLAKVVMRCLAKERRDRFPTYAALAKELEPFSSTAPVPAKVGLRVVAGVIDWYLLGLLMMPLSLYLQWVAPDAFTAYARLALYLVVSAAYFAVLENRWGASAGKALCGLRVVGPGGEKPGFGRASVRGALFAVGLQVGALLSSPSSLLSHPPVYVELTIGAGFMMGGGIADWWLIGLVLLFATARKKNGFAGIHEIVSRTGVAMKSTAEARAITQTTSDLAAPPVTMRSVGPYRVLDDLTKNLVLGYDGRLRRKVWIEILPAGAPAVPPPRRDLSRPARLHWLNGRRTAEECWDAYEAVEGTPLINLLTKPQPWGIVRHWLKDLASELEAGWKDQSLPDLGLDRVWITREDCAKLLDWRAPDVEDQGDAAGVFEGLSLDLRSAQQFLNQVALSALAGRVGSHEQEHQNLFIEPLPLSAKAFLQKLGRQAFQTLEKLADTVASLVARPARVSRRKRWVHLAICCSFPAFVELYFVPGMLVLYRWGAQHLDLVEMAFSVGEIELLEQANRGGENARVVELQKMGVDADYERIVEALEIHVAGSLRTKAADPSTWVEPFISADLRSDAERILAAHPSPSGEEVAEAAELLAPFLESRRIEFSVPPLLLGFAAVSIPMIFLIPTVVVGLLSASIFRGGLLLRVLGVGVVTASGSESSRIRGLSRAAISWTPAGLFGLAVVNVLFDAMTPPPPAGTSPLHWFPLSWWLVFVLAPIFWIAGVAWMTINPARGLQDRLAGTYLVPR